MKINNKKNKRGRRRRVSPELGRFLLTRRKKRAKKKRVTDNWSANSKKLVEVLKNLRWKEGY